MDLEFSEITETDIPELTKAMTHAFDDDARKHFGQDKGGPPGYDNGEFFQEWLFGYEWTVGYKAVLDKAVIGGIIVWIFDTGKNILGTIFIDPEFQDRGVGASLWAFIESEYPDTKNWKLETPSVAIKNHHFYEKCGFIKVEEKPSENGMPCESWVYTKEMTLDAESA